MCGIPGRHPLSNSTSTKHQHVTEKKPNGTMAVRQITLQVGRYIRHCSQVDRWKRPHGSYPGAGLTIESASSTVSPRGTLQPQLSILALVLCLRSSREVPASLAQASSTMAEQGG